MIIGIDIGSTTTKIVAFRDGALTAKAKSKAFDPITSATGAFGKLLIENGFGIDEIRQIIITGVGSSKIPENIFNIPTKKVEEMDAIGIGGKYLSQKDDLLITNIGTGTVMVSAKRGVTSHVGGSGIGGGTIVGLSKALLNTTDFETVDKLATNGKIERVDLQIQDIVSTNISFLNKDTTASNFGKMLDSAEKEDIALGILNMVFQVIGMLSVFSAKSCGFDTIVLTGNGSKNEIGKRILLQIARMYRMDFLFPKDGEYATAIGAALANGNGQ